MHSQLLELPANRHRRSFHAVPLAEVLPSGFAALDRMLPGGGWPVGGVTEIVAADGYVDPVSVLLPALATLCSERRWISWVAPPHLPVADDLREHGINTDCIQLLHEHPRIGPLTLAKQALAAGRRSAVLAWADAVDGYQLASLARLARDSAATVFLFRPEQALHEGTAAELRVFVSTHAHRLQLEILHCRCRPGSSLRLDRSAITKPLYTPHYYRRPPQRARTTLRVAG